MNYSNRARLPICLAILLFLVSIAKAQEGGSLLDDLMGEEDTTVNYVLGTFKGVKIINTASTDLQPKKELLFLITHRFGAVNSGFKRFWGLDEAVIRLGFEYGMSNRWVLGIGRSGQNTTFDAYSKFKILKQSTGGKNTPISMVWNANLAYRAESFGVGEFEPSITDKMFFTHQLLISRKFSSGFSLQLSPTFTHNNLREFEVENHDMFYMGLAARIQITKRMALLGDYYYIFDRDYTELFTEPLAFALEFQTGGHVFQLIFSNSLGMTERLFLSRTTGKWSAGDIHFGFNISRTFAMDRSKARKMAGRPVSK